MFVYILDYGIKCADVVLVTRDYPPSLSLSQLVATKAGMLEFVNIYDTYPSTI